MGSHALHKNSGLWEPPDMAGHLMWQGGNGAWKVKYVALKGSSLFWFSGHPGAKQHCPQGHVQLEGGRVQAVVVAAPEGDLAGAVRESCASAKHAVPSWGLAAEGAHGAGSRRTLVLAAGSAEMRDMWLEALQQATLSRPLLVAWVHNALVQEDAAQRQMQAHAAHSSDGGGGSSSHAVTLYGSPSPAAAARGYAQPGSGAVVGAGQYHRSAHTSEGGSGSGSSISVSQGVQGVQGPSGSAAGVWRPDSELRFSSGGEGARIALMEYADAAGSSGHISMNKWTGGHQLSAVMEADDEQQHSFSHEPRALHRSSEHPDSASQLGLLSLPPLPAHSLPVPAAGGAPRATSSAHCGEDGCTLCSDGGGGGGGGDADEVEVEAWLGRRPHAGGNHSTVLSQAASRPLPGLQPALSQTFSQPGHGHAASPAGSTASAPKFSRPWGSAANSLNRDSTNDTGEEQLHRLAASVSRVEGALRKIESSRVRGLQGMATAMSDLHRQRSQRRMLHSARSSWTQQGGPAAAQALVSSAAGDDRHHSDVLSSPPSSIGSSAAAAAAAAAALHRVPGIGSGGTRTPAVSVGHSLGSVGSLAGSVALAGDSMDSVGSLPGSADWPRLSLNAQQAVWQAQRDRGSIGSAADYVGSFSALAPQRHQYSQQQTGSPLGSGSGNSFAAAAQRYQQQQQQQQTGSSERLVIWLDGAGL
ncbi:hypothetical protein FOA52_010339 [Chlamydomonas sp. UWO 241]|nr:hypothetical protein FOA52_010339 [Chlamydomonas sp. UWO 241]